MVRDDAFGHSFSLAFILAFILIGYCLDHSCHFRLLGIYLPYIYTGLCIGMCIEPMTFRGVDPGTFSVDPRDEVMIVGKPGPSRA